MEFDRVIFTENMGRLIQQTGKKISEVEKEIGVSVGFLSRLGKPDSKYNVSAETLCKAADVFGVSVESLVKKATQAEATNDMYIENFVSKLLKKTEDGSFEWKRLSLDKLDGMFDDDVTVHFPVFYFDGKEYSSQYPSEEEIMRIGVAQSRCGCDRKKYFTAIGTDAAPQGDTFFVRVDDTHVLYLMRSNTFSEPIGDYDFFYEMCFVDIDTYEDYGPYSDRLPKKLELPYGVTPVCTTLPMDTSSSVFRRIRLLYSTVEELFGHNHVSKDARSIIDRFMLDMPIAKEVPGNVYIEVDDDELPF